MTIYLKTATSCFLLLTFLRIYNFQEKVCNYIQPGKSPGQGEFELKKCCTAPALSANDGRVEFGCVQLGKRVKYFSIPVDNGWLGRSIRITLHLVICILHSKYADLRSISLNLEFPLRNERMEPALSSEV